MALASRTTASLVSPETAFLGTPLTKPWLFLWTNPDSTGRGSFFGLQACHRKNSFFGPKLLFGIERMEGEGDEYMGSRKNARQRRVENRHGKKTRPMVVW